MESSQKPEEEKKESQQPDSTQPVIEVSGVINIHENIKSIKISPFLNTKKSWDDEEFKITPELKKGIKEGQKWEKPSRIQAMAIPYIVNPDVDSGKHESLIAQAKNGAGKSGAFIIGSLLRVDPSINKVQVIIVGHTRELVNQIFSVISLIVEHTPSYRICNLATDKIDNSAHIFVSTLGTILANISGRSKNLDLSELRVFVLDEADCFFLDKSRRDEILRFQKILQNLKRPIQYVFFSATYEKEVSDQIALIVDEAYQIQVNIEQVKLDNVQQFYYKCPPKGKIEFIKEIYDSFSSHTQTIIFVNTKSFAETLFRRLKDDGFKVALIFGDMSREERDEYIEKFRVGTIMTIITTNLLSRGFDMHEVKLVINFDVPSQEHGTVPDCENYMHRIGRAGRFGDTGLALTLFDREQDEKCFWSIINHYKMDDKVKKLDGGAQQLKQLIQQAKDDSLY